MKALTYSFDSQREVQFLRQALWGCWRSCFAPGRHTNPQHSLANALVLEILDSSAEQIVKRDHADKPSIYSGLPDDPHISAYVQVWKGLFKPVALAGIAFAAVAGFLHWIVAGPNEVQPEDEEKARHLLQAADDER